MLSNAFPCNFVEGIGIVGDEATMTYPIPMPSYDVTTESASVLDFVQAGPPTHALVSQKTTNTRKEDTERA